MLTIGSPEQEHMLYYLDIPRSASTFEKLSAVRDNMARYVSNISVHMLFTVLFRLDLPYEGLYPPMLFVKIRKTTSRLW
jgi:hypothetical protein